ncbi:hypothetical protein [Thiohalocapsa sp. ML1]|jgi:hypothetical protein|uniref:hypothetical protein n=1 Tax=Thiohalocapsa sp. ML1 TaxID=1431688 RepID=UPI0012E3AD96|nr:hypothetical protein [Thiohalocapsa sp. ML1]
MSFDEGKIATDLTIEILREIRDGITALRTEVSERIEGLRVEFAEASIRTPSAST